jgi:hypothetical protein
MFLESESGGSLVGCSTTSQSLLIRVGWKDEKRGNRTLGSGVFDV